MNRPRPEGLFRALLRLFPAEFRGDFGEQMVQDFEDQRQEALNGAPRAGFGSRPLRICCGERHLSIGTCSNGMLSMQFASSDDTLRRRSRLF